MFLSKTVNVNIGYFSDNYYARLDGSGIFTFRQVAPGNYNLSELRADGSQWYWSDRDSGNVYTISGGPLCTLDIGEDYPYA